MDKDNLYDLLGTDKDANEDDIRKAYYKLARKYHPDKNQTVEAAEMFKKISHANEVLSDPSKEENVRFVWRRPTATIWNKSF